MAASSSNGGDSCASASHLPQCARLDGHYLGCQRATVNAAGANWLLIVGRRVSASRR